MKRILVLSGVVLLLASSCVSRKKVHRDLNEFYATKQGVETEVITEEPVVIEKPVVKVEPKEEVEEVIIVPKKEEQKIVIREEKVIVSEGEDMRKQAYAYFVVLGSFSQKENAIRYKQELIRKGFLPTVLETPDTGFFRVSVYNSNSEDESRALISEIRSKYPEHNDVWLLKKL